MEELILIGGGGHCKSVIDVIREQGRYNIIGIVDPMIAVGEFVLDVKVLGNDSLLPDLASRFKNFHITVGQIGSSPIRNKIANQMISLGAKFPNIISPKAHISRYANLGVGSVIMHNVTINADATIGDFTILNNHSLIEHDVKIGNFCHISTGAIVNGNVTIENDVFIGSGSVVVQGAKIPSHYFLKANQIYK
ncbi:NeuD/PglB/VioB family sugar acetyltransferase [Leptospira perdikensis]|uniref:Acetyltransferase n=1 Tax=Leptospira perdikensis TaxID=2484948 RepID=A0A4R9JLZ8_9LEPT|nr:NeuD/PglB/VioB family sugar acetyltransferase [Leptospira perdikensis]TGL45831.1 acetyltransferase [Leptospira perdikensis]